MKTSTTTRLAAVALLALPMFLSTIAAAADQRMIVAPNAALEFARLPGDLRFPEGITANPANGDIYVGTFDGGNTNSLLRYDRQGRLVARNDFSGITPLLGLAFNPKDRKVYIASVDDFTVGGSRIRRIPADFDASTVVEDVASVPGIGAPAPRHVPNPDGSEDVISFGDRARVPNGLAFNRDGDLFFSDSFQGAIFRIDGAHTCGPCSVAPVAHDALLATAGFPPFGANGLALDPAEDALFVANTGDDRILRLDLGTGVVGVFAESVNGADGIAFDDAGNLWVAANQADNIVALDRNGRVIAQLGAFSRHTQRRSRARAAVSGESGDCRTRRLRDQSGAPVDRRHRSGARERCDPLYGLTHTDSGSISRPLISGLLSAPGTGRTRIKRVIFSTS